jgi:hypothetical protein
MESKFGCIEPGGVEWCQEDENTLLVKWQGRPNAIYRTGAENAYLSKAALANTRVPAGHPEGYLEAFANIYRNFAMSLRAHHSGIDHDFQIYDYPGIDEGVHGMELVEAMVASSKNGNVWTKVSS